MTQALIFYHGLMAAISALSLLIISRIKDHRPVERSILLGIIQLSVSILGALLYPLDGFGRLQLLAWGIFLYFPVFLLGNVLILVRHNRIYTYILGFIFFGMMVIAGDAFLIEPNLLEVTRITIYSDKIDRPLKADRFSRGGCDHILDRGVAQGRGASGEGHAQYARACRRRYERACLR